MRAGHVRLSESRTVARLARGRERLPLCWPIEAAPSPQGCPIQASQIRRSQTMFRQAQAIPGIGTHSWAIPNMSERKWAASPTG